MDIIGSINEANANDKYCEIVRGNREVRHNYDFENGDSFVLVDCETSSQVIEGGLDSRSSLDSVQQAVFFSILSGKIPVVAIYDTDGVFGQYEARIKRVCDRLGIQYLRILATIR